MSKIQVSKGLIFLAAAMFFLLSTVLWFSGFKDEGMFVGIWVPSILSLGALLFATRKAS